MSPLHCLPPAPLPHSHVIIANKPCQWVHMTKEKNVRIIKEKQSTEEQMDKIQLKEE